MCLTEASVRTEGKAHARARFEKVGLRGFLGSDLLLFNSTTFRERVWEVVHTKGGR